MSKEIMGIMERVLYILYNKKWEIWWKILNEMIGFD